MSEYLDRLKQLGQSSFGFTDKERKKILSNLKLAGGSQFSIRAEENREKFLENYRYVSRRIEDFNPSLMPIQSGDIFNQVAESMRGLQRSSENLNNANAGLNLFIFHCLGFIMSEIITDSAQAIKAKRAIEENINQNFPEDSPMKETAFKFCERFFAKYSPEQNSTIGDLSEVEILREQ